MSQERQQIDSPSKLAGMGATMQGFKLDSDSSEEDIDAVAPEVRAYNPTRIDKKRMRLRNWREDEGSLLYAFFKNLLRPNDYVFIWSVIAMSCLIIMYGAASAAVTTNSRGLMFAFTILHVILLAISMLGNIIGNRQQFMWERILQILAFIMFYVAGIIFLFISYDVDLLLKDDDELNLLQLEERSEARSFLTGELILIPMITNFSALALKAYRDNTNGRSMTTGFWILLVVCFIQCVALTAVIFVFLDSGSAWGLTFFLIFALYFFA